MGAGDGAIFTRHTANLAPFSVPFLQGGLQREVEPVLFLHGLGGGGKWESFHMALATVSRTVAPQLPGWQQGQVAAGLTGPAGYAALLWRLLDEQGLDRVAVVGHSVGGWVAGSLAGQHPERLTRLVLIDPLGLDLPEAPALNLADLDEDAFAAKTFGKLGLIATAQAYGFGAEWQNVRNGQEFERQWKGRTTLTSWLAGAPPDAAMTAALQAFPGDALLVWGRLDGLAPLAQGEALQRAMPAAGLQVVERAGHLPMIERPETVSRLVRDYLLGIEEPIPEVARVG
jgi:pimeloyl-ACP methyl ester carboxylesterase